MSEENKKDKEKKKSKNKGKAKPEVDLSGLLDDESEDVLEALDTPEDDQDEQESGDANGSPQIDLPDTDEDLEDKLETFDRAARLKIKRKSSKDEPSPKKGAPLELDDPKPAVHPAEEGEQSESQAPSGEDQESLPPEGDAGATEESSGDSEALSDDTDEGSETLEPQDSGLEELEEEGGDVADEVVRIVGDASETESGGKAPSDSQGASEESESVNGSGSEEETLETEEKFEGGDGEDADVLEASPVSGEKLGGEKEGYDELYERYLRIVADFDNYKKRMIKEKADIMAYGNEELIKEFLTVVDNLERALQHSESPENTDSIVEGIKLVHRQFLAALEKFGVKPIEISPGEKFDPRIHQAIEHVEAKDLSPGLVLSEILRGYMLKDKLIRPSLVAVSRAENTKKSQSEEQELEESS